MDYEHDDRRPADVPGATGAEGSGLPAGHEPLDAGSPSSRSPEVRAFDPHPGSGQGPSGLIASGDQADDLFDAMFLTGGLRPPAFAAVDHDLGFPPPQAPDLATAFLAALDAIDDRRFVTPVPEEPPAAPVVPAAVEPAVVEPAVMESAVVESAASGEPAYELRPQSRLELESEATAEPVPVDEASAQSVAAEDAVRLPWDTGRVPVAGLLTTGEMSSERVAEPAPAPAMPAIPVADETWAFASYLEAESNPPAREAVAEAVKAAEDVEESATVENAELDEPIEEAAYYAAGIDGDAGDSDEAEAAAIIAAEAAAEAEETAAAAAQAEAEAEAAAAAARAEADAEAEALARAIAEAEQAELEAAIAAEAALDEAALDEASAESYEEYDDATSDAVSAVSAATAESDTSTFGAALETSLAGSLDASLEESLDSDAFNTPFDVSAFDETLDETPDVVSAAALDAAGDLTPGDDDEFEPSIGNEPMDAAPMAFDGPDAFAPAAAAQLEPEPEPESDEIEELQDFVVFSLGDMRCVVPIRNVVEVGRIPDAAPVPNAPAWLYGLGNLRGQVLSLIDLRALFGVGRIKASSGRMVVLRGDADDISAGVMVDQVHQIVALSPSRFKEAPAELPLPDKSTEFVWGACDYGNYTMIGLDVDGVLGVESMTEETV